MPKTTDRANAPLVVGVGGSAGGLSAVEALLRPVPAGRGFAFIVALDLEPRLRGAIVEVLARATPLAIAEATDGLRVETDRVYVAPAHCFLSLEGGVLRLAPAARPGEAQTVLDRFFQSLARDQGDRAVAVLLSGVGSDGSLGIRAVSEAGGLAMVQDPATAEHPSMPRSAADTSAADHVAAPDRLAAELVAYALHLAPSGDGAREAALYQEFAEAIPQTCEVLLQATGHNFRHYKTSTLTRRTLRRAQVLRLPGATPYLARLREDPSEAERVFRDLLISVTAFFRDPDAFAALASEVLPRLLAGRGASDPVRVWVPGCATGEEAYTLAMLLRAGMEGMADPPTAQVFATDLDEAALATARQGAYPLSVADEVPEGLRQRYFVRKGQRLHVVKEVREMVLFSPHNLINDPPFSKLDLISCRNLLIYLGSHLQKKLVPTFHYALRPGGFLFLGPSENLDAHRELFRPVDARHRISQRLPTAIGPAPLFAGRPGAHASARPSSAPAVPELDTYLVMQRIVLDEFAPKAVVVNEEGQVVSSSGNLEKYLTVAAGAFHNRITRLVREGLRVGLRAAMAEAARVRRKVVHEGLSLRTEAGVQQVMLTVQPMPQLGEDSGLFLVVFQDVGRPLGRESAGDTQPGEAAAALIEQLERELARTREDLERTVQDLEAAVEELKSSNEELLSMNEELQSANEELETSKEEVQAANGALAASNGDLENLLASTRIATLFLDDAGNVRRVTPTAGDIYNLRPADCGRPLAHFTHNARAMPPLPGAAEVHGAARAPEDEVEMLDGRWFLRRVLPYQTAEGVREGVVVTFTDMTDRKRVEDAARESERQLRRLAENMAQLAWTARPDGYIEWYNRRWYEYTGTAPAEMEGWGWRSVHDPATLPKVLARWQGSIATGEPFSMVFPLRGADGIFRSFLTRVNPLKDAAGAVTGWFGTNTDLSELE